MSEKVFINKGRWAITTSGDTRAEILWKYTLNLLRSPLVNDVQQLEGKKLCCSCNNGMCHGEVLTYLIHNPDLIARCGKACTDKENIAEIIFEGLGWEHKKAHVQLTLF